MSRPPTVKLAVRGDALLDHPRWNKGTAFTQDERKEFNLTSRLPSSICSLDLQLSRAYKQYQDQDSDMKKNSFLWSLQEQSWTLFYSLLSHHLTETFPIIYTPTEAQAIASYSHVFRKPQSACFLAYPNRDTLEDDLRTHLVDTRGRKRDIELVVVSDGEAILGIGDQGVGGSGISTAKSVIYTLAAGIDPSKILAVSLDVGTNNEKLLKDDLYVGWRHKRLTGDEYDSFVDRFLQVLKEELPHAVKHFEDFGTSNAQRLLDRYRDDIPCFNDDIQGTGAVTLAALISALHVSKTALKDQTILCYGAGTAGLGIVRQIRQAMTLKLDDSSDPISEEEANKKFILVDKVGLLTTDDDVREGLGEFARDDWDGSKEDKKDLEKVVKKYKPTVIIGTSTNAGAWTEKVIKEMAKHTDRPIVFPLSNPTKLAEAQPKDILAWTEGKALIVTGSPFEPVEINDRKVTIGEGNNALIYPSITLGAILASASAITDSMIVAATRALAALAPALKDDTASLLPEFEDIRSINFDVALAVLQQAIDDGTANCDEKVIKMSEEERRTWAAGRQWSAEAYPSYTYDVEKGEI